MAYRAPNFMWLHAAQDTGVSNITSSNAHADYPLDHLIDNRPSSLFKFNTSASAHWIKIDRGSASEEQVGRMIIPEGHNLSGSTWTCYTATSNLGDTAALWAASGTYQFFFTGAAGNPLIDKTFGTPTQHRWIFLVCTTGSGQWEIGQLFYTRTRTMTTRGPDPKWTERPVPAMIRRELATREANSLLAPNRIAWELKHHALDSTDVAILDDLLEAVGVGASPFYYDSTDNADAPRLMRISNLAPPRIQDHPIPAGSGAPTYELTIEMLEQTS